MQLEQDPIREREMPSAFSEKGREEKAEKHYGLTVPLRGAVNTENWHFQPRAGGVQ